MIILALVVFGLALGSFVNALVWRLHKQDKSKTKDKSKYSIKNGRSMCTHCSHELAVKDLVPLLSWLWLRGKCRYCGKQIHWQYPLVEATTAILFAFLYVYWPQQFIDLQDSAGFVVWLFILTGLIALVVYDIRWMLLPNRIIFPLIYLAAGWALAESLINFSLKPIAGIITGAAVGGGLFFILFQLSRGKWIGGGDVKLGFLLGIILASGNLAFMMIFLSSALGVAVSTPLLISGKVSRTTRIPFGPFLIASTIIIQLFGQNILDWYLDLII